MKIIIISILRGVGQVMFQNNAYSGALFLAGIFYNSIYFGISVAVGATISTLTASLMNYDSLEIKDGVYGFNGALVTLGLAFFLEASFYNSVYIALAAIVSTLLTKALMRFLKKWRLPTLTAPFVLTALIFLLGSSHFGRIHSTSILPKAGLTDTAFVEGVVSFTTVILGTLQGIGQVFFQENAITGLLFLLGIFINSKKSALMILLGSFTGLVVAWFFGVPEQSIRSGAFGFNSALTALALGSIFLPFNRRTILYSTFGAIATAIVFASTSVILGVFGMPALTLPFVVVTWFFLLTHEEMRD